MVQCYRSNIQFLSHVIRRIFAKDITTNAMSVTKGPATRNDFVNDARADAIFSTLKAIVDDEKSTISLRVAHWSGGATCGLSKWRFNVVVVM